MKIVLVTDLYYPSIGGVEVETRRMATKLSESGHDVWIIAPSDKHFRTYHKDGPVNVVRIKPSLKPVTPLFLIKTMVFGELRKINPKVIHVQTTLPIAKAASLYARKFKVACVATGHYADGELEYGFKNRKLISKIIELLIDAYCKTIWKNVDIVTFPSMFANNHYRKLIKDQDKIITVSNGIEIDKSDKLEKKSDRKTILYVGRFEASKNVETIIKAMPAILAKSNTSLVLVGGGTGEGGLRDLVEKLGIKKNVLFTGFAMEKKVKRFYKMADIFVTASAAENQPLAILEAISSGLPVVASGVGGIPEIVKNGVNGYLFNPNDSASLAKKVVKILSSKKLMTRMSKESLKIARKHDINEVVIKMQSLYQKAIAISSMGVSHVQNIPFYRSKGFSVRFAVVGLVLAFLFRNVLASPSKVSARELVIKNKIMNSKIVKKIEKRREKGR